MKGYFFTLLLCLSAAASAQQGQPLNVEKFSTFKSDPVVRQSGWIYLGKTDNAKFWYAHTKGNLAVVGMALKVATKAIGDEYSTIEVDTGFVNCSEAPQGKFPLHLHSFSTETNDAQTGEGSPENMVEPNADSIAIQGGTAIGDAVKRSCVAVMKEKS